MNDTAVFTIVSKNYLSYARVLMQSVGEHQPDYDRYVILADRVDGCFKPELENFQTIEMEELNIPDQETFTFKYSIMELNTAVKPFSIDHLFSRYGYQKVIYLDPDILVMRSLQELGSFLDKFSIVLTPHFTKPIPDDGKQLGEIDILRAGCYNLGFMALSSYAKVKEFLDWWKDRLLKYCYSAPEKGLFVDQKWIDLVPSLCDGVYILKHPGYNAAYWNLHERTFESPNGNYQVNNEPLFFYHFSGIDFNRLELISKYQNRYRLQDIRNLEPLFLLYRDLIIKEGYETSQRWPYFYGSFDNGIKIVPLIRKIYSILPDKDKAKFGNPFKTAHETSFFTWLCSTISRESPMSHLLYHIYNMRSDLQRSFPRADSEDWEKFAQWARSHLQKDYGIDRIFCEFPMRKKAAVSASSSALDRNKNNILKSFLWECGTKHASLIKSIPLVDGIAEKVYWKLDSERNKSAPLYRPSNGPAADRMSSGETEKMHVFEGENGINLSGYIDTESGVGEAARGMIRSIERSGIKFVLNNIEQQWLRRNDKTYTQFSDKNPYAVNLVHVNADQVPNVIDHMGKNYFRGKYNIGYWFWELAEFPDMWHNSFSYFNEIWVASDFLLDSISKASPVPVVKIPVSVEVVPKNMLTRKDLDISDDAFVFLNMFDCRSFPERKNPLGLIEAFRMAYNDLMCRESHLVLKLSNPEANPGLVDAIREKAEGLPVMLLSGYFNRDQIHDLEDACDCYVSLHRSEGLGLPLAECMYLGKPAISTAYSGNLEFMNINNSFLVKYRLVEITEDIGPYKKGGIWAEPDVTHAAELLQSVYDNRSRAKIVGETASHSIREQLSPESLGKRLEKRLTEILGRK